MTIRLQLQGLAIAKNGWRRWAAYSFFSIGVLALGYSAYEYLESWVFQTATIPEFDSPTELPGPKIFVLGAIEHGVITCARTSTYYRARIDASIGKIEVPRLGVSTVVVEGVSPRALRLAVGHIPGTALPGENGNIAIAGHRDTFFRKLRDSRSNDTITFATRSATYTYAVESVQVVEPNHVQALAPSSEPVLTLITCYPFNYVGPAPRRLVVRAGLTASAIH